MSTDFNPIQLAKLFSHVLSYSSRDDGGLSRIALKACISSKIAVKNVILLSFDMLPEYPNRSQFRLFFMKLGRSGLANEFIEFLKHKSPDVRFATTYALSTFGTRNQIEIIKDLLSDADYDVRLQAQKTINTI